MAGISLPKIYSCNMHKHFSLRYKVNTNDSGYCLFINWYEQFCQYQVWHFILSICCFFLKTEVVYECINKNTVLSPW